MHLLFGLFLMESHHRLIGEERCKVRDSYQRQDRKNNHHNGNWAGRCSVCEYL